MCFDCWSVAALRLFYVAVLVMVLVLCAGFNCVRRPSPSKKEKERYVFFCGVWVLVCTFELRGIVKFYRAVRV